MSNKIDTSVSAAVPAAAVRGPTSVREKQTAPPRGGDSDDSVALTSEAQTLQQVEQRARGESGVDTAKVAEVKRQLADGSYQVDPRAIASKLLQSDYVLS